MKMEKYSMGVGDRFAKEGVAQLSAFQIAAKNGVDICPVWNKSNREHTTLHTEPASVREEADNAVKEGGWTNSYYVDADHINLDTVDWFLECSDFFTLDVADFTGEKASDESIEAFVENHKDLIGTITLSKIGREIEITEESLRANAEKYLLAVQEAAKIYKKVVAAKGEGTFVTEVSMDETDKPQTPDELLLILAMVADAKIPAQTIAPKFSGEFLKGVDYVGDPELFATEFEADVNVLEYAVKNFGLPENLKMSVHSGSDKFSIYPKIKDVLSRYDAGLHLKTAGTTWLEEITAVAEISEDGLAFAKEIYGIALERYDEFCGPYATVLDIDKSKLPTKEEVDAWSCEQFAKALRHDQSEPAYNLNFRQLIHVAYKVAGERMEEYLSLVEANKEHVGKMVAENIYEKHIAAIFPKK